MSGTELSGALVAPALPQFLPSDIQTYMTIVFALVIVLWLTVLVRVLKDSIARSNNVFFHILSILLVTVLTPFVGLPIYLAIRPIYYHPSRYFGRTLLFALAIPCPQCRAYNDRENHYCTDCGHDITHQCSSCHTHFSYQDEFCHHCGRLADAKKGAKKDSK